MEILFNTKLKEGISLYHAPTIEGEDLDPIFAVVKWAMDIDAREWGLKSITSYVTKVTLLTGDGNMNSHDLTEDISEFEIQIEFGGEYDFHSGHLIEPEDIDIDFQNKSILVMFNIVKCR